MSLPIHIARVLLADPVARRRYVRVGILQTVAALALALSCMGSAKKAASAVESPISEEEIAAEVQEELSEAGIKEEAADQAAKDQAAQDEEFARRLRDVEAAAEGVEGGPSLPSAIAALVATATANSGADNITVTKQDDGSMKVERAPEPRTSKKHRSKEEKSEPEELTYKGFSLTAISFWVALLGALQIAQWVIIALSRDYHDAIAREAALLTRVDPDDEAINPRVRVNVPWMRKKVRRRVRAMLLFAAGVPAALLLSLPFRWIGVGNEVFTALTSVWGMWWLLVFTAAKSGQAWEAREGQRPPWFLRAWTWLTTRVPGFRWGMFQRYGAMWNDRTKEVFEPVATVERHPWAYAGLALTRFIGSFAPLRFFVRPLIPVASAHILREERMKLGPPRPDGGSEPRTASNSPISDSP
ncbi:hypothetical protein [Myxococcus landrumensis]|uniref:DUF2868 domain-containing protein n=1 Tax=Myxococcus landrumensis TaxID=2813577 RepID=A0ABX7NGQ4_9BACT|nr:hypothetical protein [Myxococcus landrumus]QSQ16747.1 hypothetical protein JY572_12145 [Myxococcus landrumus]